MTSNNKFKNFKKVKSPNELSQTKKSPSKKANKRLEDFQNNPNPLSQNNEDINLNNNNFIQYDENQNLWISQDNKISKLPKFQTKKKM